MASMEATKEFASSLPSSIVTAVAILMVAVAGGLLMLALNIATIESFPYSFSSANDVSDFGGGSYAYY